MERLQKVIANLGYTSRRNAEELIKQGKVKVGKVNVDDNQELAIEYGIMSIPNLIFFKNGNKVKEVVGFHSKSELEEIIKEL